MIFKKKTVSYDDYIAMYEMIKRLIEIDAKQSEAFVKSIENLRTRVEQLEKLNDQTK